MCGRYVRKSDKQSAAQSNGVAELDADYNVAPTTYQPMIRESRETGEREMVLARWSLVPFFTKQLSDIKGLTTINARADTVPKAPTWREPFHNCMLI